MGNFSVVNRETNETLHFGQGTVVKIGQDKKSHLQTSCGARMQAVIEVGSDLLLVDLGSEPGTQLNGARVNKAKLEVGDVFTVLGYNEKNEFEVIGTPSKPWSFLQDLMESSKQKPKADEKESSKQEPKADETCAQPKEEPKAKGPEETLEQQIAKILENFFEPTSCPLSNVEAFLKALLEESSDPPATVLATRKAIKNLRDKVSKPFETIVTRFVLDNEK